MKASNQELALARCDAAERLEAAVAALGVAHAGLVKATNALEMRTDLDLGRALDLAIILHLSKAGLGAYLERRLVGPAPSLRELVERQHRKTGVYGLRAD
jgi:hypothetical protein